MSQNGWDLGTRIAAGSLLATVALTVLGWGINISTPKVQCHLDGKLNCPWGKNPTSGEPSGSTPKPERETSEQPAITPTSEATPIETPEPSPTETPTPEAPPPESLKADYSQLDDLLKQGKWKEADQETSRLMLQVANRESEGWLDPESIKKISCTDLKEIDRLWVKYSEGHFGFSVQKSIIQKEEYDLDDLGDYRRFMVGIGWRKNDLYIDYDDGQFSLRRTTPKGHLPSHTNFLSRTGIYYLHHGRVFFSGCHRHNL